MWPYTTKYKAKIPVTSVSHPHAILTADKKVMAIRNYPRTANSVNVVPIPDHTPVKIGWQWTGTSFIPPLKEDS